MVWDAENYRDNSSVQSQSAIEALRDCPVKESDRVLDIGCGDGKLTKIMADLSPLGETIGIDISKSMIDSALNSFRNDSTALSFILCSSDDIQNLEGKFDLITAFSCIHWFRDVDKVLRKVLIKLSEAGTFLAVTYPRNSLFWDTVEKVAGSKKWGDYFVDFVNPFFFRSGEEYENLFNHIGFFDIRIREVCQTIWFDSLKLLAGHTAAWLPQSRFFSCPIHKQEFSEDFCLAYLKELGQKNDGKIWIPCETMFISAKKSSLFF